MKKSHPLSRRTIRVSWIISVALATGIFIGCSKSKSSSPADSLNSMDHTFLTDASFSNYDEIDASKLSATQSSNATVKTFAVETVNDHRVAEDELGHIADSFRVPIPAMPDSANVFNINKLKARTGTAFDTTYMRDMIVYQQGAVSLFQKELNNGKSSRLQQYANKYLSKIQRRLTVTDSLMTVLQQH